MDFIASTADTYITANSYLELEAAEPLITGQKNSAAWTDLSDEQKQSALIFASKYVDGAFVYNGEKTEQSQNLQFPRNGETEIRISVRMATAVIALKIANDDMFKGIEEESVGKLSIKYAGTHNGLTDDVLSLLRPLRRMTMKLSCG